MMIVSNAWLGFADLISIRSLDQRKVIRERVETIDNGIAKLDVYKAKLLKLRSSYEQAIELES